MYKIMRHMEEAFVCLFVLAIVLCALYVGQAWGWHD